MRGYRSCPKILRNAQTREKNCKYHTAKFALQRVPELSGTFTPMKIISEGGLLNFGN